MNLSPRTSGVAGILAGAGYLVQALAGLLPQTPASAGTLGLVLEGIYLFALLAALVCLLGLAPAVQKANRLAGSGAWLALLGAGLMAAGTLAARFLGEDVSGLAFLSGVWLAWAGYILFGLGAWRAKRIPLWVGLGLIFGFPLSLFINPLIGGLLYALAWLGLGAIQIRRFTPSVKI